MNCKSENNLHDSAIMKRCAFTAPSENISPNESIRRCFALFLGVRSSLVEEVQDTAIWLVQQVKLSKQRPC